MFLLTKMKGEFSFYENHYKQPIPSWDIWGCLAWCWGDESEGREITCNNRTASYYWVEAESSIADLHLHIRRFMEMKVLGRTLIVTIHTCDQAKYGTISEDAEWTSMHIWKKKRWRVADQKKIMRVQKLKSFKMELLKISFFPAFISYFWPISRGRSCAKHSSITFNTEKSRSCYV